MRQLRLTARLVRVFSISVGIVYAVNPSQPPDPTPAATSGVSAAAADGSVQAPATSRPDDAQVVELKSLLNQAEDPDPSLEAEEYRNERVEDIRKAAVKHVAQEKADKEALRKNMGKF